MRARAPGGPCTAVAKLVEACAPHLTERSLGMRRPLCSLAWLFRVLSFQTVLGPSLHPRFPPHRLCWTGSYCA